MAAASWELLAQSGTSAFIGSAEERAEMKRALIDDLGRIAQVEAVEFPVAEPFFWVDCPDDCEAYQWQFDPVTQTCSAPIPPVPTPEEIQKAMTDAVQKHLDAAAQARGYDGILSAASYAGDTHPPFDVEGIAYKNWRSAVWLYCYQVLADVKAGTRAIPTPEALIAELPVLAL